jgi:S1-C subfamily serine protease
MGSRNSFVSYVALLLLLFPAVAGAQSSGPVSPSTIYERSRPSIVVIITADKNSKPIAQGSGFIVGRNRVVTNHHVIEDAENALVVFADGTSALAEGVAADSPARDLAILVVKTGPRAALKLGDELSVKQGDSVFAIGAPRGLELSITNGIVSGFRDVDERFLLQTTAAIAPGSSGGPLFDNFGRVIGVTTSGLTDSPGIYFSIGARDISRMLRAPGGIIIPLATRPATTVSDHKPIPAPPAETAPSVGKGSIHVVTDVIGATATLYGPAGRNLANCTTPCSFNDLDPKRYSLQVQKDGYQSVQTGLELKPGETQEQKLHLERLDGGLLVTSAPPGADVFINGAKQSGQTPVILPLAPGQYDLVLRLPGYEAYAGHVQVKDNVQTSVAAELKEKSLDHVAWAQVTTTPSGAEIFIDGKSTGQFSPARVQMPTGGHTIMMKLNGFQLARRGVQVSEGGTVIVTESLKTR